MTDAMTHLLNIQVDVADDDGVVDFTQEVRRAMVKQITVNGTEMPTDAKDGYLLLTTLDHMSKLAMSKKKLGVIEKAGNEDRKAALLIAAIQERTRGVSPFEVNPADAANHPPRMGPPNLDDVADVNPFPETAKEQGLSQERYDSFNARMAPIVDARKMAEQAEVESQFGGDDGEVRFAPSLDDGEGEE